MASSASNYSDRTIYNLKPYQERFRLSIRKNFLTESAIKHCNGLPRDVVESLPLKVSNERLDVALSALV